MFNRLNNLTSKSKRMSRKKPSESGQPKPLTQKSLAEHLKLSPSTISLVMNNAPRARLIPEATRNRIIEAAREFNYRPDFYAKYLYTRRSYTVAILMPEIREAYAANITAGIDEELDRRYYLYFTANHHGNTTAVDEYASRLIERAAEGFIFINTPVGKETSLPIVCISSQPQPDNVGHVCLNNILGGRLALEHLAQYGHRRIAVIKGHPWRAAAEQRWQGIQEAAQEHGVTLSRDLVAQLKSENRNTQLSAPAEGYEDTKVLLARKKPFTAVIAFNDVTAIGAIHALREAGLRVPEDVAVIGFDDIEGAEYLSPSITTLRQPLATMGRLAAAHLLETIEKPGTEPCRIIVDPVLIPRESTAVSRH